MPKPSSKLSKTSKEFNLEDAVRRIRITSEKIRQDTYDRIHARREYSLFPNEGRVLKIAKYSFGFLFPLTLGTEALLYKVEYPSATHRTRRVIMTAPIPGMVYVNTMLAANISPMLGGSEDAYAYRPESRVKVDWPTIVPSNPYTFSGTYTGKVPPGWKKGEKSAFSVSLIGPAVLCGEAGSLAEALGEDTHDLGIPIPDVSQGTVLGGLATGLGRPADPNWRSAKKRGKKKP